MSIALALVIPLDGPTDTPESRAEFQRSLDFAKSLEFQGVEIASPTFTFSAADLRKQVENAGLKVACLATHIRLDGPLQPHLAPSTLAALNQAAALGASFLRIWGYEAARGEPLTTAIHRVGLKLAQLADAVPPSSSSHFSIVLENGGAFTHPADLWKLCDLAREQTDHPQRIGISWDLVTGCRVNEGPARAVPTLNSRLAYARAWDAAAPQWTPLPLGAGQCHVKTFLERLRGIGYHGWVAYSPRWPAATSTEEKSADLVAAAKLLREWAAQTPSHEPAHRYRHTPAPATHA